MEFEVTPEMAANRTAELLTAGEALGLTPDFVEPDPIGSSNAEAFGEYLETHGVEFFSLEEVVTPHRRDKARQAGIEDMTPPRHLWPWSLLVLKVGDLMRREVGNPIRFRNLYRPMSYNRLVAKSGITSDHPNACAGDFDFQTEDQRRIAEQLIRDLAATNPELELSLGMGGLSLHVGIMSPKGSRSWFYNSYTDPRVKLDQGRRMTSAVEPEEEEETSPDADEFQPTNEGEVLGGDEASETNGLDEGGATFEVEVPLTSEVIVGIIDQTAVFESKGNFSAMNLDGEFEGNFNKAGKTHAAFETYHIGLSYGIVQFTQDSGVLGQLLENMRELDPDAFSEIFGPSADELLAVTTADGPASRRNPPRGPRIRPVDGADLWVEPWTSRFKAAGQHPAFQDAQRALAASHFLEPMLTFAGWLGLNTDRALSIVFDRAIQQGKGGARRWIMNAVGPIDDPADVPRVLGEYGFSNIFDFQKQVPGLRADGDWGPKTHAAVCWFERQRSDSDAFVIHVPDRDDMIDMMVVAAADRRFGHRVERLRDSNDFTDTPFSLLG